MVNEVYNKIKSVLIDSPRELYEKDRRFLKESFYFAGNNEEAILLIHGWTSVPYELRRLGKYLNENGYTVSIPMLRGHGTKVEDLENVKWQDWMEDVQRAHSELTKTHKKIYIAGTSLGASLTVMLAEKNPNVSGIILMAMPYKVKLEKISAFLASIVKVFRKYNKKFYPPTFGAANTITRLISYQTYPISSAQEVYKLIKITRRKLSKITNPCFIMQSSNDHIVTKNSLEKIYKNIGSKIKIKKYINRAYHTFISDINKEHIFEDILSFIKKN